MLETVDKSRDITEKREILILAETQKEKYHKCKQMRTHWENADYNCYYHVIPIRLDFKQKLILD